jgi:xanthosine utilization system XapX-like protein
MLNLPLVPFEFFLFSILLCYTAGMLSAFVLFLLVIERKPPPTVASHGIRWISTDG